MADPTTVEELKELWGEDFEAIYKFVKERTVQRATPDEIAREVEKRFPSTRCSPLMTVVVRND